MWIVLDRKGNPREVYPWSTPEPRHRRGIRRPDAHRDNTQAKVPRPAANDRIEASDEWPTPPLRRAMAVLGKRAGLDAKFGFKLDDRPVDARRLVVEANAVLRKHEKPPIEYPGLEGRG